MGFDVQRIPEYLARQLARKYPAHAELHRGPAKVQREHRGAQRKRVGGGLKFLTSTRVGP
jgi:hypothetical protein